MCDLHYVYFGCFINPFESLTHWLGRVSKLGWETHTVSMGFHWSLERGTLPRCSLGTMWALTSLLTSARSLPAEQSNKINRLLETMWLHCHYTGHIPAITPATASGQGGCSAVGQGGHGGSREQALAVEDGHVSGYDALLIFSLSWCLATPL